MAETAFLDGLLFCGLSQIQNKLALFFSRIAWRREEALAAPAGASDGPTFASGVALAVVEEAAVLSSRTFSAKTKRSASRTQISTPLWKSR